MPKTTEFTREIVRCYGPVEVGSKGYDYCLMQVKDNGVERFGVVSYNGKEKRFGLGKFSSNVYFTADEAFALRELLDKMLKVDVEKLEQVYAPEKKTAKMYDTRLTIKADFGNVGKRADGALRMVLCTWGRYAAKYDLRKWDENGNPHGKGHRFDRKGIEKLAELLREVKLEQPKVLTPEEFAAKLSELSAKGDFDGMNDLILEQQKLKAENQESPKTEEPKAEPKKKVGRPKKEATPKKETVKKETKTPKKATAFAKTYFANEKANAAAVDLAKAVGEPRDTQEFEGDYFFYDGSGKAKEVPELVEKWEPLGVSIFALGEAYCISVNQ